MEKKTFDTPTLTQFDQALQILSTSPDQLQSNKQIQQKLKFL